MQRRNHRLKFTPSDGGILNPVLVPGFRTLERTVPGKTKLTKSPPLGGLDALTLAYRVLGRLDYLMPAFNFVYFVSPGTNGRAPRFRTTGIGGLTMVQW